MGVTINHVMCDRKASMAFVGVALFIGVAVGWFAAGIGSTGDTRIERSGQDVRYPGGVRPVVKPKCKAPIRSSADTEVQKRILRKSVAFLEKRLVDAKKEADRIEAARAALKASGMLEIKDALRQRDEALKRLDKKMSEMTVGEMRTFAPDWHAKVNKRLIDSSNNMCGQVIGMIDTLLMVDASSLSDEDRKVHEEYMAKLAEVAEAFSATADAVTDDMPYVKFMHATTDVFEKHVVPARELGKAEDKVLSRAVAQSLGLSDEEMKSFLEVAQESHDAVRHAMRNGYMFYKGRAKRKSDKKAESKGK